MMLAALIAVLATQDVPVVTFETSTKKGGLLTVEGSVALPEEAIVDVVVEKFLNRANYANPVIDKVRADMPMRSYAEISKGKFKATFPAQVVGFYYLRIDFQTKFQRSNKVGKSLVEGKLKEFQVEELQFLGTTDELIDALQASIAPAETIARKLQGVLDSALDPKTDPGGLSAQCDKISDEIDRIMITTALPATMHALKGNAENLATQFRGTAVKKPGSDGRGAPPAQPQGNANPQNGPEDKDKQNPGHESPFLKPGDNTRDGIKIGDRFGPAGTSSSDGGKAGDTPTKTRERLNLIQKLYLREIAVSCLDRARDLIRLGQSADAAKLKELGAQMKRLSEAHDSRASGADSAAKTYLDVTTVDNLPLSKFFEKALKLVSETRPAQGPELDSLSKESIELWSKFNAQIRNRTR